MCSLYSDPSSFLKYSVNAYWREWHAGIILCILEQLFWFSSLIESKLEHGNLMNLLLFTSEEMSPEGLLVIRGSRAEHLRRVKQVTVGSRIRTGVLRGRLGYAMVSEIGPSHVTLSDIDCNEVAPERNVTLILALPRPQTLKKVLETAAAMGVSRLMLINSARVEKSYFSAKILKRENIEHHLLLGLAQGVTTLIPEVSLHRSFRSFLDEELPLDFRESSGACHEGIGLLAHPVGARSLAELEAAIPFGCSRPVYTAVGPEGGWNDYETGRFLRLGFYPCSFGPRILRVETAVCAILSQLELVEDRAKMGAKNISHALSAA